MKKLAPLAVIATLLSTTALAQEATVNKPEFTISGTSEFYYKDVDSQIASQKGDSMGNTDNEIKFTFTNKTDSGLNYGMVVEMATVADSSATIDESSIFISGGLKKRALKSRAMCGWRLAKVSRKKKRISPPKLPRLCKVKL